MVWRTNGEMQIRQTDPTTGKRQIIYLGAVSYRDFVRLAQDMAMKGPR